MNFIIFIFYQVKWPHMDLATFLSPDHIANQHMGMHSFAVASPTEWNKLSQTIRNQDNVTGLDARWILINSD